jgi:O-antigen/teichoic acid export membrane protein
VSIFKRLIRSPASRTAAASYIAFTSTAFFGLLSIPIAVAFLEPAELGLWSIVNAFLGYLVWMDLGVGSATGRMMAEAVAKRDQSEINQWWTATRAVLVAQGLIVIVIGFVFIPLILHFLNIPGDLREDAIWLLVGGILITGISLPMRGAPGLLTAQNRFYWIPLIQATTPWINLLVFFLLLRKGLGLQAYIWAMATSQIATWIFYSTLILTGPNRPRMDLAGINRFRFVTLFKFSGNLTISGLSDAILKSMPAILIARLGGLAAVPVYNFTWKGPTLASGLVNRTYQSFYPGMQRNFVSGRQEEFRNKHQACGMLTLGIALSAAGMTLAFNNLILQALAGNAFYAGPAVNTAFALAMITMPMAGLFKLLMLIAGDLGKIPLLSILQLAFFILTAIVLWPFFGIIGIAFAFAITPLFKGIYGYFHGTKRCGFPIHGISKGVALAALSAMVLVVICGAIGNHMPWHSAWIITIPGRELVIPPITTLLVQLFPTFIGIVITAYSAVALFRSTGKVLPLSLTKKD